VRDNWDGRRPQSWPVTLAWSLTVALVCLIPADAYSETGPVWMRDGGDQEPSVFAEPPVEHLQDVPPPAPAPSPKSSLSLSGLFGGVVSMGADVTGYEPAMVLSAQAPLSNSPNGPILDVTGEMLALQGADIETGDIAVFKSLELGAALWQPFFPKTLRFGLYGQVGAASRRKGATTPAEKSPLWATLGLGIRSPDHSNYLAVGLGPDERISEYAQIAITVQAKATLPPLKAGVLKGTTAALVISIVRGLDVSQVGEGYPTRDGGRSSIRVALLAGWN